MTRILLSLAAVAAAVIGFLYWSGPPPGVGKGWKAGAVIPPPLRREMELTAEQIEELDRIEDDVRRRLIGILTDEQLRKAEELGKRPPTKGERPEPEANAGGAILWFTSLDAGLKEAKRTGRPILLVSAAPSCSGVSGVW